MATMVRDQLAIDEIVVHEDDLEEGPTGRGAPRVLGEDDE